MPATSDIVTAALRKIRVVASDEPAEAETLTLAVDELNRMLHAWKLAGVDLSHTNLAATDTFPLNAEFEEGTVHMLAARLSPDYNRPVGFDADDFLRKIQAAYMTITEATIPLPLTQLPSQYWPDKIRR